MYMSFQNELTCNWWLQLSLPVMSTPVGWWHASSCKMCYRMTLSMQHGELV
jgi:hypothetical protein